ncbi:MAG: hypothetical protein ACXV7G_10860 [Halobacteriota archaeon]
MKPLTLALCVTIIAALIIGTCGCTSTSNTTSSSSNPFTTQQLAPDNLAGAINDKYKAENYTVNTPFTMTKQGNKITYKGVVTDGPKVSTPYKRNITIVLSPDRTTARTTYNNSVSQQQAKGYQKFTSSDNAASIYWVGYLGTTYSSDPSTPSVRVRLQDPGQYTSLALPGANLAYEYLSNVDLSNHFEVTTDQQTPAPT